jgi:large-conductance mechanosensitive channel
MIIGSILLTALGIIVSAGVTAIILAVIHAMCSQGDLSGFSTYFAYSAVFYSVTMFIYMSIVGDILNMLINFFKK